MFFGLAGLTENVNFTCGRTACYGVGYVPGVTPQKRVGTVFLELQRAANLVARQYGFSTVDEDELIGTNTANLLNKIARRTSVGALVGAPFTLQTAASNAAVLTTTLNALVTPKVTTPPWMPTITPVTTPTTAPTITTITKPPTKETITTKVVVPPPAGPKPKTKIIMGVVAGAFVLGAGIAVVAVARRKKLPISSRGGPSRRAKRR